MVRYGVPRGSPSPYFLVIATLLAACGDDPAASSADAGVTDASTEAARPDAAADATPDGDAAALEISVSPLTLVPPFSPDIHDYYVRCAAGDNPLTVTVTDATGTTSTPYDLLEDQAVVAANDYWIRCLPHDFPVLGPSYPSGKPTPGYYLLESPTYGMVLDTHGTPVWYARGTRVLDVDALATDTISLMPTASGTFGTNPAEAFEILSLNGDPVQTVKAVGTPTDGHDLRLLPGGDHVLLTYPIEQHVDLTGLGKLGSDETMADCEVQEIDPGGNLVWSWLASDHVDPVTESLVVLSSIVGGKTVRDVFHCNSVDVDASGNLLVSFRQLDGVIYIDRQTGKIAWKLGGTPPARDGAAHIQIVGDPQVAFTKQHDARILANGDVTLFDDHTTTAGVARGVEYAIDHGKGTATVAWQVLGKAKSQFQGSFRRYPDGESVVGWGGSPQEPRVLTEVDASGDDVFDLTLSPSTEPYRAIKVPLARLDIGLMRLTAGKW